METRTGKRLRHAFPQKMPKQAGNNLRVRLDFCGAILFCGALRGAPRHVSIRMRPSISQKRPIKNQNRPSKSRKRPGNSQKRDLSKVKRDPATVKRDLCAVKRDLVQVKIDTAKVTKGLWTVKRDPSAVKSVKRDPWKVKRVPSTAKRDISVVKRDLPAAHKKNDVLCWRRIVLQSTADTLQHTYWALRLLPCWMLCISVLQRVAVFYRGTATHWPSR